MYASNVNRKYFNPTMTNVPIFFPAISSVSWLNSAHFFHEFRLSYAIYCMLLPRILCKALYQLYIELPHLMLTKYISISIQPDQYQQTYAVLSVCLCALCNIQSICFYCPTTIQNHFIPFFPSTFFIFYFMCLCMLRLFTKQTNVIRTLWVQMTNSTTIFKEWMEMDR